MGRKKISIKRLSSDRARTVLFFKRMPGVLKKAAELHELCGAEVGIYVRFEGELHVYESNGSSTFDEVTMASRRQAPLNYLDDSHVVVQADGDLRLPKLRRKRGGGERKTSFVEKKKKTAKPARVVPPVPVFTASASASASAGLGVSAPVPALPAAASSSVALPVLASLPLLASASLPALGGLASLPSLDLPTLPGLPTISASTATPLASTASVWNAAVASNSSAAMASSATGLPWLASPPSAAALSSTAIVGEEATSGEEVVSSGAAGWASAEDLFTLWSSDPRFASASACAAAAAVSLCGGADLGDGLAGGFVAFPETAGVADTSLGEARPLKRKRTDELLFTPSTPISASSDADDSGFFIDESARSFFFPNTGSPTLPPALLL